MRRSNDFFEFLSIANTQRLTGTRVDPVFSAHPVLRALAEVYALDDGARKVSTTSSPRGPK